MSTAEAVVRARAPGAEERNEVRDALLQAWRLLGLGDPEPGSIGGQLLRARFGLSAAGRKRAARLGDPLHLALLAVQLAHEASLLHDDVVDGADTRRNRPTLVKARGVGAALLAGDLLLARAYLAAARTGSLPFAQRFARAVEATIAGEWAQGAAAGTRLDDPHAREIARAKSGELFGCALSAAACLQGAPDVEEVADLGRDVGLLYQRVDDLLDFCPGAGTGKPPLADLSRGLWTWPRAFLPDGAPPAALFREGPRGIPARAALADIRADGARLLRRLRTELPGGEEVRAHVRRWLTSARDAVEHEISAARPAPLPAVRPVTDPEEIFSRHGRTFHFASRLMPSGIRDPVSRVYAFCRVVDDAVDRAPDQSIAAGTLDTLHREALRGYEGEGAPGSPFHRAMEDMREAAVPFSLVEELFEGVRMDLRPRRYDDGAELRVYTHRVAGTVGLWMAGLAGVRDPWALDRAEELGHAMQLTNIVRDVGADLALGRVYLPRDLMERHGLSEEVLQAVADGEAPVPPPYAAALEELMGWADAGYGAAFQAIPHLPRGYRRAVAVAARVYQGIHREIRRNGYDTLSLRAHTGTLRKLHLAGSGLAALHRAERLATARSPGARRLAAAGSPGPRRPAWATRPDE
jgi:15-cis-phytoene synthase